MRENPVDSCSCTNYSICMQHHQEVKRHVDRLNAIVYSIVKRHPETVDWNLELSDVGNDELPQRVFVGWNTVDQDAIVTVLFGESLEKMEAAARGIVDEANTDGFVDAE